ncbi:MAG: hypothetical protein ABA06_04530 [Parcubacteria bacterium C7867-001]|nr:MAG: hypothetical protein ABA06_04530 [Parcubacteria bacterium C7867-001]
MKKMLFWALAFATALITPALAAEPSCVQLTPLQKAVGVIDTPGVLLFLGALLVLGGVGTLLSKLIDFDWMSANMWGILGCVLSGAMLTYGSLWGTMFVDYLPAGVVTFIGALVLAPSVAAVLSGSSGPTYVYMAIMTVAYTISAGLLVSSPIGFLAVIAFLGTMGFTAIGGGLSYAVGYEDDDHIPGATIAAFGLCAGFSLAAWYGVSAPWFAIFKDGAFWMGTFVTGIGVLIMSSRWYGGSEEKRRPPYAIKLILGAGIIGLGVFGGLALNNGQLLYIAAAFGALFIIEKMYEVMPENAWAYGILTTVLGTAGVYGGY